MPPFPSIFFFILLLPITISSETTKRDHICSHHLIDWKLEKYDIPIDSTLSKRALQSYQNIRIIFDYSAFTGVPDDYLNYIQNNVLLPAKNYFEATLKVKPISKLTFSQSTICSGAITVPLNYTVAGGGVNADLVIFFTKSNDSTASYVAYAGACIAESKTNRPIFGRFNFNLARIKPSTNNVDMEQDISITMHEMTHVLGFSSSLYDLYINPATNLKLTGHYYKKTLNGLNSTILNLPLLTDRLRNYYNCSTLEGAYLENEEGTYPGSHFERRVFHNEYMTGAYIKDQRITEFTLALLEGTGWYQVDYSMAEPIIYGKNKGCDFFNKTCVDNSSTSYPARFEEFCSPLTAIGCSWTLRGGSFCGTTSPTKKSSLLAAIDYWGNKTVMIDTLSDNCPAYILYSNTDCEDTVNQAGSALKGNETYGYGSKCFLGTLYPAPYSYSTTRMIGEGYGGKLKCPDPVKFCTQIENEGYCRRKCSGRGLCVDKICQCVDGWTHHDCSKRTYKDNCTGCAEKDPLRTSCYGDTCVCNPSNTTCMCELGLTTGSVCVKAPQITNTTGTTGSQNSSTTNITTGISSNTTNSTQNITGTNSTANATTSNGTTTNGTMTNSTNNTGNMSTETTGTNTTNTGIANNVTSNTTNNGTNSTNNKTTNNGTMVTGTQNNETSNANNGAQNITNGTNATEITSTNSTANGSTSNETTSTETTNTGTKSNSTNSAQNTINGTIVTDIAGTNSTANGSTSNETTGTETKNTGTKNNGTSNSTNSAQNTTNGTIATEITGTNSTADGTTKNGTTSIGTGTKTTNNEISNATNGTQNITNGTNATEIITTNSPANGTPTNGTTSSEHISTIPKNAGNTSTETTGIETKINGTTGTTGNGTISNGNNNVKYTNSTSTGTSVVNIENSNQANESSISLGAIVGGAVGGLIALFLIVFLVKKFAGTLIGATKAAATKAKAVNFTAINTPVAGMSEIITESPLNNQKPALDTSQIYLQITQQDTLNSPKEPQNRLVLSFGK